MKPKTTPNCIPECTELKEAAMCIYLRKTYHKFAFNIQNLINYQLKACDQINSIILPLYLMKIEILLSEENSYFSHYCGEI